MTQEQSVVQRFYTALAAHDWRTANACYADDAVFGDEVFTHLNAQQVRAMWQMLLTRGKDLKVDYALLSQSPETARVRWTATYTFSQTGRKVVNVIDSTLVLRDGQIVRQHDVFNFPRWARQALGPVGLLLGWTDWLKRKVQKKAMASLEAFMQSATRAS
ncbi:MAG TPA: nuclear transport factor 2 family protein [Burkholderiaceae bacterium]|nr:nuclear transport factor 2 family protein [Burkholderiaceae bacterium]